MIQTLISSIAAHCNISVTTYEQVQGGDINECYRLQGHTNNYFLKLNNALRFPGMFAMEAAGLNALHSTGTLPVSQVIQQGITNETQWLLLQWIDKGPPHKKTMENFGAALANMHRQQQPFFGWQKDNYIGSLQQQNNSCDSWAACYGSCRIMPLVKELVDAHVFTPGEADNAKLLCKRAGNLFPDEPPALLHGDLWSGNYSINTEGNAVIFDPAVYYGHREMDMGMTRLFGGFDPSFYNAYNECYPLEKNWQQRLPLTQLYPLLVHAILFGGHYIANAREIIKKYGGA